MSACVYQADITFQIAFSMAIATYSIISTVKLFGSNIKLFVNKLAILSLISFFGYSVTLIICDIFVLNNTLDYTNSLIFTAFLGIFSVFSIFPLLVIINLRNNILIKSRIMSVITKILALMIVAVTIACFALIMLISNILGYTSLVVAALSVLAALNTLLSIFDIISNIYLLKYYNKYYFRSTSVMKHLQFQMVYRKYWIYFVISLEVVSLAFVVTSLMNIYPYAGSTIGILVVLLQLNTMIDFVKFDTIRSEVTIGDQTIYFYEDSSNPPLK